jgi:hypothetical protein
LKTQWIIYKGKKILLADYSEFGFNHAEAQQEMEEAIRLAQQEPLNSVLTLTLVRGTKVSPAMFSAMQRTANQIKPYARRRAVVGAVGTQLIMLEALNRLMGPKAVRAFDTAEQAKEWLISE